MTRDDFDDARIVALMQAYLSAEYRVEIDGQWHVFEIGAPAAALEAAFPEGREFGLLSAWNPYSVERPLVRNREADEALHAKLRASGESCRPGFSSSRNRSWREPSWVVVDMPLARFDALAREFGQLASLHARRGEPMRLRMLRARPAGAEGDFVDWIDEPAAVDA